MLGLLCLGLCSLQLCFVTVLIFMTIIISCFTQSQGTTHQLSLTWTGENCLPSCSPLLIVVINQISSHTALFHTSSFETIDLVRDDLPAHLSLEEVTCEEIHLSFAWLCF
jgi:hypothetical protein